MFNFGATRSFSQDIKGKNTSIWAKRFFPKNRLHHFFQNYAKFQQKKSLDQILRKPVQTNIQTYKNRDILMDANNTNRLKSM